jgi:beta-galactosidase/beta-glucuronidase
MKKIRKNFEHAVPDLFIVPDFDNAEAKVSFTIPRNVKRIKWSLKSRTAVVKSGTSTGSGKKIKLDVHIKNFRSWSPDSPFLYKFIMEFKTGKENVEVVQHFGMRKFSIENKQIMLNNRPLFIRGHIRGREAHDHPNFLGCSDSKYYAKNILMSKAFGFNFVRFHSKVPPREFFEEADRLGFLAHIEVRKYYGKYQKERELEDMDLEKGILPLVDPALWKRTIKNVRNFPSLMVYCLGNEIHTPGINPEVREKNKARYPHKKFQALVPVLALSL